MSALELGSELAALLEDTAGAEELTGACDELDSAGVELGAEELGTEELGSLEEGSVEPPPQAVTAATANASVRGLITRCVDFGVNIYYYL